MFEAFKQRQRESLIHKYLGHTGNQNVLFTAAKITKINTVNKVVMPRIFKSIVSQLGYDYKKYKKEFITEEGDHKLFITGAANEVILNPLMDKWMSVNEFFRNEYLFMTVKTEYMHPAKGGFRNNLDLSKESTDSFLDIFGGESATRLSMMAKRNVAYTGTTELPSRNSRYGTPDEVKVAAIDDVESDIFNIAGDREDVKVHDGSSYLTYQYSRMIDNSYQGKGYTGTKKQLGTFITEFGSSLKKDAETVITNDKIRNSNKSVIKFRNKQRQMLGLSIAIDNYDSGTLGGNNTYFKDGEYFAINRYVIEGGKITIHASHLVDEANKVWETLPVDTQNVTTLASLWELFGAENSVDSNLEFSEGSNDMLFDLITNYEVGGKYPLKDRMIHITSNKSSLKSGATNVHPSSY
ncbi:MAG: hypothetical protein ACOH2V_01165 [Candidatus Saccharimonadaceae bacterium]